MALLTHLLACVFGTGSWVAVNGLWVELPLLVTELPEKWYLPSYITIIIQLANVGPLLVTLLHRCKPGLLSEVAVIYSVVTVGVLACLLLAFLWDFTSPIAGELHSTAFFGLAFCLALVDCTSSVTFLPFMARLQPQYVTTYFVGEGLSGFIPALVALAQGAGIAQCINATQVANVTLGNTTTEGSQSQIVTQYLPANFSTLVFFLLLATMMVACLVAFFFLTRLPKAWELSRQNLFPSDIALHSFRETPGDGPRLPGRGSCPSNDSPRGGKPDSYEKGADQTDPQKVSYSLAQFAFIYLLVAWVNSLTNGILPSVQAYSCLPYGNLAYHLSAALSSMANPLACTIAMFLPSRSLALLGVLSMAGTGFGAYNMAMAVMSPCPLLQSSAWGHAIIVSTWHRSLPRSPNPPGSWVLSQSLSSLLPSLLLCLQIPPRCLPRLPTPIAVKAATARNLLPVDSLSLLTGHLMGVLHGESQLREGDDRRDPAEPEPQRPCVVRGSGAAGVSDGGPHHVPPGECLQHLQVS
uniref:Riboflavin transporter n=1 Tax=Pelusios castaneus TaxID=367368 RepID=A0A8C8R5P9_9SAUR